MRILVRVLVIAAVLGVLSACKPAPPPPPAPLGLDARTQAAVDFYPDSAAAIRSAFARFGPATQDCALRYAARESGLFPGSDNGSHHGMFQLHAGYWGSIEQAAADLGRWPDWYDPWVNAYAAAMGFELNGWRPWRPTLSGCA